MDAASAPRTARELPSLRATLPHLLYQFCLEVGLSAHELEARWGVPGAVVSDPDAWMPYSQGLALWDALIAHCPDQAVGVRFGAIVGFVDLGAVGLAAAHASTVEKAFETFAPLRHLVDPTLELELLQERGHRVLVCASHETLLQRVHPMEAMLVSTNTGIGRLTLQPVRPRRVEFARKPRGAAEVYLEQFGVGPEVTGRYALSYPESVWKLPIAGSHPLVLKYLVDHATAPTPPARAGDSVAARLERWLSSDEAAAPERGAHTPALMARSLPDAARAMGTSRRDLQRRLQAEGTSFKQPQEGLAQRRAHALLQAGELNVSEIAHALGYAEPRSFQRACYRWFKTAPGAQRTKGKSTQR